MPEEVSSTPSPGGGAAAREVMHGTPPVGGTGTTERKEHPVGGTTERKEEDNVKSWFKEMRGWLMVVAVQVVAFTYQAGLSPPGGFCDGKDKCGGAKPLSPVLELVDPFRYIVFFSSNTTAFVTSLAIIILLMNKSIYFSRAKVTVLEIIVVLDMMGLMAAYWAGSTRNYQTNMFAILITAFVLFVIYVIYAVQLVYKLWELHKLCGLHKVWGLVVSVVVRPRIMPMPAPDAPRDSTRVAPANKGIIHDSTRESPVVMVDMGRSTSEMRHRDGRTPRPWISQTGQPTMLAA